MTSVLIPKTDDEAQGRKLSRRGKNLQVPACVWNGKRFNVAEICSKRRLKYPGQRGGCRDKQGSS
jgi:hypothetical protein